MSVQVVLERVERVVPNCRRTTRSHAPKAKPNVERISVDRSCADARITEVFLIFKASPSVTLSLGPPVHPSEDITISVLI